MDRPIERGVANRQTPKRVWLTHLAHFVRVAIVAGLMISIPSPRRELVGSASAPPLAVLQESLPSAVTIDQTADASGMWTVRSVDGKPIAKAARTLPAASDIVGYRGPSEVLILIDRNLTIAKVALLGSDDTMEHVQAIQSSPAFFDQFNGWKWSDTHSPDVDAVSGATLTSFAIAEGILKRLGGEQPSLVFPDPLTDAERAKWLGDHDDPESLVRTGTISDDIAGYQGPTELLFQVDGDILKRVRLRYSYDNEPYVGYVADDEWGFWPRFEGRTLAELARLDLAAEGIEGVSGATMTSMAVAKTIVGVANQLEAAKRKPAVSESPAWFEGMRWQTIDSVSITILFVMLAFSRLKLFRIEWLRRCWLVAVIIVIGFWAGNLVSMALIAGMVGRRHCLETCSRVSGDYSCGARPSSTDEVQSVL